MLFSWLESLIYFIIIFLLFLAMSNLIPEVFFYIWGPMTSISWVDPSSSKLRIVLINHHHKWRSICHRKFFLRKYSKIVTLLTDRAISIIYCGIASEKIRLRYLSYWWYKWPIFSRLAFRLRSRTLKSVCALFTTRLYHVFFYRCY